ncbi:C-type LECtin [Aphelenchoides bicaudatus]|nr:C-type LECtin [Aphelenchoides bicaudatus]
MCYLLPDLKLSWADAKTYCSTIGSDLLSPKSRTEYAFVKGLQSLCFIHLTVTFNDRFNEKPWKLFPPWIDLSFGTSEFLWNGQTKANFTMWLESEPSNIDQCIVWRTLDNSNSVDGWKSLPCKYEQPVVCQQPSNTCKTQIFTKLRGRITSLAFPKNYDNDLACYYHILARPGFRITLFLQEFYTEFMRDTLNVYDGANTTSKLLASKSGRLQKEVYRSSDNSITLLFITDKSSTKRGWLISYLIE